MQRDISRTLKHPPGIHVSTIVLTFESAAEEERFLKPLTLVSDDRSCQFPSLTPHSNPIASTRARMSATPFGSSPASSSSSTNSSASA